LNLLLFRLTHTNNNQTKDLIAMRDYENDDDDDDDDDDVHHEKSNNELHIACSKGDLVQVQAHVRNFDINAQGKDGETALLIAATEGHIEIVKLLLSFNPDARISNVSISHSLYPYVTFLTFFHRIISFIHSDLIFH